MLPWAVVLCLVSAGLVWMAPVYLFAASFMFAQIFQLLPSRSATYVAVSYSLLLFYPVEESLGHTFAMIMCGIALGTSIFSRFVSGVIEQSRERGQAIRDYKESEPLRDNHARKLGELEERSRLARELHDTVTQDLIGITRQLELVERVLPSDSSRVIISRVRDMSQAALADARGLIDASRPRQLAERSLADALMMLRSGDDGDAPRVDVIIDSECTAATVGAIDAAQECVLLRVAQEALSNARRHAHATRVTITLSTAAARAVMLDIHDDGCGFDVLSTKRSPSRNSGGFGLESMRDRVHSAHGRLDIESNPDQGTVIHVELPVA